MNDTIIYDQPLNEVIRVCLRLEYLFQQIDHSLKDHSTLGTRILIGFINDVLHILDRPDLKAKLAKEMTHHLANLMRYGSRPEIDSKKLTGLTQELEELSRQLIDSSGKLGQRVRDIELLNTLRLHLASPGGGCSFDIPMYHYWLQQPARERQTIIEQWLQDFEQIRRAITLVLDLVRNNGKSQEKTAIHGFHQELLDSQSQLSLIRIGINSNVPAFPEVSVGRHFFSVRFFIPNIVKRPSQYLDNLVFLVIYCSA